MAEQKDNNITNDPSDRVDTNPVTEDLLLETARGALSNCNWVVGECAAQWTEKFARGRSDAEFGSLIHLSGDQVYQRRRVWETFHDVREDYPTLKWSHFYVAINWDDASECLQWAVENDATIAEMKAWRRSIHGEDLTTDPDDGALQALDYDNMPVHPAGSSEQAAAAGIPFDPNSPGEFATAESGEASPYAPFRKDARGDSFGAADQEASSAPAVATPTDMSPLRVVKRAIGGMRRLQQQLGELSDQDYNDLTPEIVNQLWDVYEELGQEIKRQG